MYNYINYVLIYYQLLSYDDMTWLTCYTDNYVDMVLLFYLKLLFFKTHKLNSLSAITRFN